MKNLFYIAIFVFNCFIVFAQTGEIQGRVLDMEMKGEGLPFANVYVEVNGKPRGTLTSVDGRYSIKFLPEGVYTITCEYVGYEKVFIGKVKVLDGLTTIVNFEMFYDDVIIYCPAYIIDYPTPLLKEFESGYDFAKDEVEKLPTNNFKEVINLTPGIYAPF